MNDTLTYDSRVLYSIREARFLLGGISQTTLYALLRTGELASVVIGCRRFISRDAISEFVKKATIMDGPVRDNLSRNIIQRTLSLSGAFCNCPAATPSSAHLIRVLHQHVRY